MDTLNLLQFHLFSKTEQYTVIYKDARISINDSKKQLEFQAQSIVQTQNYFRFHFEKNKLILVEATQNANIQFIGPEQNLYLLKYLIRGTLKFSSFQKEYQVLRTIKQTSISEIYEAQGISDNQHYFVKKLRQFKTGQVPKEFVNQCILENYDNITTIRLINCYISNNSIEMIFPWHLNSTLDFYIECGLSLGNIQIILKKILTTFIKIHELGLCHMDINCKNILIPQFGNFDSTTIIDYGSSILGKDFEKEFDQITGTPGFIAPEVFSYRFSEKSDIFSLGVVFHSMLTGKGLFSGNNSIEILIKNKNNQAEILANVIDPYAFDLLMKMIALDPNERMSSVELLNHQFFSQQFPQKAFLKTNDLVHPEEQKTFGTLESLMSIFKDLQ